LVRSFLQRRYQDLALWSSRVKLRPHSNDTSNYLQRKDPNTVFQQ
jgi:hypothetical protein